MDSQDNSGVTGAIHKGQILVNGQKCYAMYILVLQTMFNKILHKV
jgi:hypothetical protein